MDEKPADAVRAKPDSSLVAACRAVADGRADAVVCAPATPARCSPLGSSTSAGCRASVGRRSRSSLPSQSGPSVLIDSGANADARPEHLLQFGQMGAIFAEEMLEIAEPGGAPALDRRGAREGQQADARGVRASERGLRARLPRATSRAGDLLSGGTDVVVTDGFTGNVSLKLLEGTIKTLLDALRSEIAATARGKVGGLLIRPAARHLRARLDPDTYGGAYLLGLRGLVVIAHGNSNRRARRERDPPRRPRSRARRRRTARRKARGTRGSIGALSGQLTRKRGDMAASREEVFERVKDVLSEQLGVDENEVTEEASFQEDLDADSLDLVELIMELEDQFGIKISDEDAQKITDRRTGRRLRLDAPVATTRSRRPRPARAPDRAAPRGAAGPRLHPLLLGARPGGLVRAARVPRRQRARARGRARAVRRYPDFSEGRLAKVRSHVVSRASCAVVARDLGLGEQLVDARGARARTRSSSASPEPQRPRGAARGRARRALPRARLRADRGGGRRRVRGRIDYALTTHVDHKTELQEALARLGRSVTLRRPRGAGPAARAAVHLRGDGRRRAARRRDRALEEGGRAGGRQAGAGRARTPSRAAVGVRRRRLSLRRGASALRLQLRGFKSFPDPVEIRLEPGVAVVVGPERLGQVERLGRDRLGDGLAAPSELRAEKPDDVLFAGSRRPARADFCEVELVFDNADGDAGRSAVLGGLARAPAAPRRRGPVPR